MSEPTPYRNDFAPRPKMAEHGHTRVILLGLVLFLAGMAVGAFLLYQSVNRGKSGEEEPSTVALSATTRSILQRLNSPLEIRYYSLIDPASATPALTLFVGRVQQLLSACQQAAQGKLKVVRFDSATDTDLRNAALADGVRGFNLDKGAGCYLGLVVEGNGKKEALAQLSPEYEPALELDLARVLVRVNETAAVQAGVEAQASHNRAVAIEEVKRVIPNIEAVALEDGKRMLRENAIKEFSDAARQWNDRIKEAEDKVKQATSSGSETEKQAARAELQRLQAQEADQLKDIAIKSQAQLEAFGQLKSSRP